MINLVLVWCKSVHFWQRCAWKTSFRFSFLVTLTFEFPKFVPLVTLVQCYLHVFTEVDVSTAFPFVENRRQVTNGQIDGVQHLIQPSREGCIITLPFQNYLQPAVLSVRQSNVSSSPVKINRVACLVQILFSITRAIHWIHIYTNCRHHTNDKFHSKLQQL